MLVTCDGSGSVDSRGRSAAVTTVIASAGIFGCFAGCVVLVLPGLKRSVEIMYVPHNCGSCCFVGGLVDRTGG